ncbi:hypothetical protein [Streptomyces sp. XY332]|nr:hypothetical protein [Streptomyces sp. XY332]
MTSGAHHTGAHHTGAHHTGTGRRHRPPTQGSGAARRQQTRNKDKE